jgi:hypothetical protein
VPRRRTLPRANHRFEMSSVRPLCSTAPNPTQSWCSDPEIRLYSIDYQGLRGQWWLDIKVQLFSAVTPHPLYWITDSIDISKQTCTSQLKHRARAEQIRMCTTNSSKCQFGPHFRTLIALFVVSRRASLLVRGIHETSFDELQVNAC